MWKALKSLGYSRKFWLLVVALFQTILFQFVPGFPAVVWQAIDGLLAVLIGAIALEDGLRRTSTSRGKPFASLVRSRKFLLAVVALFQTIVFQFVDVPPELWQAIDSLIALAIGAIALEDGLKGR